MVKLGGRGCADQLGQSGLPNNGGDEGRGDRLPGSPSPSWSSPPTLR